MRKIVPSLGFLLWLLLGAAAVAQPAVNVATAPDARSVAIGTGATIFAEFVNSGDVNATNCQIARPPGVPINLSYQTLTAGGALSGTINTPATVLAGASQRFLVSFTATAAFEGRVRFRFTCDNATPFVFEDVNDLFLTASMGSPPDLIAIFATPSGDGVLRVSEAGGIVAAGGAVVNIGSAGADAMVDVRPTFGDFDEGLGVVLSICETNPVTAACLAPPAPSIMMSVGPMVKTYSVFAIAHAGIGVALFPEYLRVSVIFSDPAIAGINGAVRGRASVAFTSPPATITNTGIEIFAGEYRLRMRDLINDPNSDFISVGELVIDAEGNATGLYHRFNVVDGSGNFVGETDQVFTLEGVFDPVARTFAGELVFVPDFFLNTPPLRGTFVANFDPLRSMRGTYSALSDEAPSKGPAAPATNPTGSPNIQVTGASWLAIRNCGVLRNAPGSKVFDIFQGGVRIGEVTVTRNPENPVDFTYEGTVTNALGMFMLTGSFVDVPKDINFNNIFLTERNYEGSIEITTTIDGSVYSPNSSLLTRCTATGFTLTTFSQLSIDLPVVSLSLEFRMQMP